MKTFTVKDLTILHKDCLIENLVITVNELLSKVSIFLSKGLIEVFQSGESLVYKKIKLSNTINPLGSLNNEDGLVYQVIKNSGEIGIWTKDIKLRTGLHQTILSKALKSLETRKLIKTFKNQKVFNT